MDGLHDGHRERMRTRYASMGLNGFAEHEVLELMLTYAIPRKNTNDIAHTLLKRFGSLSAVIAADANELSEVDGISNRIAVFLKLFLDVPTYLHMHSGLRKNEKLSNPTSAARFALNLMKNERYECVYVLSLSKTYELLHAERLFSGTLTETPLYPRRIVEAALRHKAYAALLLHNHPSGDPSPSSSDIEATRAIKSALNSIDIKMYDHIIVGRSSCYSIIRERFIDDASGMRDAPASQLALLTQSEETLSAAEKEI